ncbi:MAG: CHAT domain-containing protein [Acidimicrobiales bacterium]
MANDAASGLQRVRVEAVHGSLECAGHHVVVGHFLGVPISGAEAFLDERLGRRLSGRQSLGLYPERVGESVIVDSPDLIDGRSHDYPPGAIVVGLDLPGELTRDRLTATVSAALLEYAIRTFETHVPPGAVVAKPCLLEVAAVPIGTIGVGAMSIESCVAALVDGVLVANELLYDHVDPGTGRRTWDEVRIAGLDIVELLGDRAELIAHAIRRTEDLSQVNPGDHSALHLAPSLRAGQGALPASLGGGEAAGAWQRVIVRDPGREQAGTGPPAPAGEGATVLEFTAIGRRARADRMQVVVDPASIDGLVESAFRDGSPAAQVRNTLYELLIPNDLKTDLAKSDNLQFIVDENTADLPWEWLTARLGGSRPRELAVRGGFLRQFRETEAVRDEGRAPHGENALVIGNPPAGVGPSLPGASREAAAVTGALRANGFDVAAMVWDEAQTGMLDAPDDPGGPPGARVLDALFSRDWRVLHIAAHGRFVPGDSSTSGVVIDAETTLTANVLRQLPAIPELVFLNCCELGRVAGATRGPAVKGLAASVARELMRIGVRAVVAAGWVVDDDPAVLFAETFYRALLEGAFFGTAVQRSREAVYRTYPGSSTWAAFQCYGDPGWFLRSSTAPPPTAPAVVSASELLRRVQTITVLAGKIGLPDFGDISRREVGLGTELDDLRTGLAERRWDVPAVLYEFGRAYGELGRYDDAVECYRAAWEHPASNTAPVRLLEQLGNLEIRLAQRRFRAPAPVVAAAGAEAAELLDAAAASVADPTALAPAPGATATASCAAATSPGTVTAVAEAEAEGFLAAAGVHLQLAIGLGHTVERAALLGSFHKKAATMTTADARHDHLAAAARWYLEARQSQLAAGAEADPYVTLNWLQMAALTGDRADPTAAPVLDAVDKALAAREQGGDEQFWTRVAVADVSLTRAVLGDPVDVDRLEDEYRRAFDTRSSRRDRDSVVDHLRDIADLHVRSDEKRAAHLLDLVARLDRR